VDSTSQQEAAPNPVKPDEEALWYRYRSVGDQASRDRLVTFYYTHAKMLAATLYAKRVHNEFEFGEYMQFASVGLLEAIDQFDINRGASFKTFAAHRIQGAILSGLEKLSDKQEQIGFRKRIEKDRLKSLQEQSPATINTDKLFEELAALAIGLALGYLLEDTGMYQAEAEPRYQDNTYKHYELKELQARVREIVDALPEQERHVIRHHYLFGLTFDRVAEMMGLTKGRVSQIHKQALQLMRRVYEDIGKLDLTL
jgi:RNA polymerase sigma factor FliA